jgi:hypothetical protein
VFQIAFHVWSSPDEYDRTSDKHDEQTDQKHGQVDKISSPTRWQNYSKHNNEIISQECYSSNFGKTMKKCSTVSLF